MREVLVEATGGGKGPGAGPGGRTGESIGEHDEVVVDGVVRRQLYLALNQSPSKDEKTGLAEVFAASGDRDSIPYLETLSKDPDSDVAKEGLRAIQSIRTRMP